GDLLPQSRWLLEIMIREHFAAIQSANQRTRSLLEPLLPQSQESVTEAPGYRPDWKRLSLSLFERINEIDRLIHALFGGSEAPQGAASDSEQGVGYLHTLNRIFQRLEAELNQARSISTPESAFPPGF